MLGTTISSRGIWLVWIEGWNLRGIDRDIETYDKTFVKGIADLLYICGAVKVVEFLVGVDGRTWEEA